MVAVKRRYKGACTLTVHTVMEFVGYCLGVRSSSTLYSYLHLLKGLGLLDFKGHVTTLSLPGEDGALLCVRLGGCKAAKLSRFDFDLAEAPRDLQGDIERGHTVYRLIQQLEESSGSSQCRDRLKLLTLWSLNPAQLFLNLPLESDSSDFVALVPAGYPTEIFDVVDNKHRNKAGALLISRLKKSDCWDELWRDQDQWVGRPVVVA